MFTVRRALLSVSDKRNLIPFARGLNDLGVEILSTGGTCRQLNEAGIDAIEVSSRTGFPEIMGGRVKTLHPVIHGGLLGRRGVDEDTTFRGPRKHWGSARRGEFGRRLCILSGGTWTQDRRARAGQPAASTARPRPTDQPATEPRSRTPF